MRRLNKIKVLVDGIVNFCAVLGAMIIVFLLISICVAVFMRYFLHQPIGWVVQISEYCVPWVAFLGAAWLEKKDKHIRVELVIAGLKDRTRTFLDLLTSVVAAATCMIIFYFGVRVVVDLYARNVLSVDILELPLAPVLAVIPLGLLLLFTQLIRRIHIRWQEWRSAGAWWRETQE